MYKRFFTFCASIMVMCVPAFVSAQDVSFLDEGVFSEFTGQNENDFAGGYAEPAGDVNNDGYADILIGATYNDAGGTDAGAAYLIYGRKEQLANKLLNAENTVRFKGEAAGDYAGRISMAGDVNNDGYDDIVIGAPKNDAGGNDAGAVYLIYGRSEKLTDMTLNAANTVKFTGQSEEWFGARVATAKDVNNDGYDDMLFRAPSNSINGDDSGAVYLVYGQSAQFDDMTINEGNSSRFLGEKKDDLLGFSLSTARDVNSDGYGDILIGTPDQNATGSNSGAVYLIYGKSAQLNDMVLSAETTSKLSGEAENDGAGKSVSTARDINHDGYDDIIIGAELHNFSDGTGAAYIIYGQNTKLSDMTLNEETTLKITGAENEYLGEDVSTARDVNNDGYDDVLISAYGREGIISGSAYILYGPSTQWSSTPLTDSSTTHIIHPEENIDETVDEVSSAGDVNNDGYDDILIGNYSYNEYNGIAYLGYIYAKDEEETPPTSEGVEIEGDGQDNDGDGKVDEANTVAENGAHPEYAENDPNSQEVYEEAVKKIEAGKDGKVKVTYADDTVYKYTVYDVDTDAKTKVKSFNGKGYLVVMQPKGKKLALINAYTGEKVATKKLSDEKWKNTGLKIAKVQGKNVVLATGKKDDGTVLLSLVKVKLSEETFKKLSQKTYVNAVVDATKTKGTDTTVQLRNSNSTVLKTYNVTEDFDLVE